MTMIKLTNLFILMIIMLAGIVLAQTDSEYSVQYDWQTMPRPDDDVLTQKILDVRMTFPHLGWGGCFPTLVEERVAQWNRYRDAVIYILENDQELNMHGYIMVYYLKRLSPEAWEKDGFRLVTQFLEKTEGRDDLKEARNQALETLFFRATEHQIARYLRNPADMKLVQDYLTSIWTQAALEELSVFLDELKSEPGIPDDKHAKVKEITKSIATIKERLSIATLPRDEIPQDYFETEGKRQYEEVINLVRLCPRWDHESPPDFHDGADHVVRYWEKYRLGAYYLMEKVVNGVDNFIYIGCAICPVHTEETTMILAKLLDKSEQNPDGNVYGRAKIVECYMYRITVEELNRRFQKYLFEYGNHLFPELPDRFGAIGNQESLSILKKAEEFWREKKFQPYVELFQKNIRAIEQRLGIAPTAEPVDPQE